MDLSGIAGAEMKENATKEPVIVANALIGIFDILGAKAMYDANENAKVESIVRFIVDAFTKSIQAPKDELLMYVKDDPDIYGKITKLIDNTLSYVYGDTIVVLCDVSAFCGNKMLLLYEYFWSMAIEVTRYMFMHGIPIRGCLNLGTTARYTDESKIVVSGKAYVDAIRNADGLEFSGTVLTDEFYKVIAESNKDLNLSLQNLVQLPCVVKDRKNKNRITQNMWCIDWLDDTDFLKDQADVRKLILDSFSGYGKGVHGSVIDKVNNTETIIRLMKDQRLKKARHDD